jgi:hypothetical protein
VLGEVLTNLIDVLSLIRLMKEIQQAFWSLKALGLLDFHRILMRPIHPLRYKEY